MLALHFKPSVKRQERINARVRYIEGDFTAPELAHWMENFVDAPEPLTAEEKAAFVATLSGVALSSDAFFPFRDNIDQVRAVTRIRFGVFALSVCVFVLLRL